MITRTSHRTTLLLATFAFQIFAAQGQPGGVAGTVTPQNVGGITPLGQPGRAYPTGRDKISASPRFREAMLRLGETNQWKLGPRKYNADDHCVGQTYVELWQRYHDDKMIQPRKLSGFDDSVAHPRELAKVEWPNETRDCVKTHFSTIQSAWTLRQSSPYRKFDRYRISLRHFSHSLAIC